MLFILYLTFALVGSILKRFEITSPFACFPSIFLLYLASHFVTNNYGIGMAYSFSLYYYIGMILKYEKGLAHRLFEKNTIILLCGIVFLFLVPLWYRTPNAIPEDMHHLAKSIPVRHSYKLIVAILGSISIMGLCRIFQNKIDNKWFQFIGRNTMGIYVTHQTIIWLIMHCLPETWTCIFHGTIMMLLLTITVLLLSIALMFIIKSNKFSSLLLLGDSTIILKNK